MSTDHDSAEITKHDSSAEDPASLIVFSDDWGRHPSSCQHLIRQLLPRYNVLWVNTIGMRTPRLNMATVRRCIEKLKQWVSGGSRGVTDSTEQTHAGLTVVNPRMWPWFSRPADRRFNAWLLQRQLSPLIAELPQPVSAVTTLPITADLPGRLPVCRWLYYCVDDFSKWPGLDGRTMQRMDEQMIQAADSIVAVSENLQHRISRYGRDSHLLTHGVDLAHWGAASERCRNPTRDDAIDFWNRQLPAGSCSESGPTAVFWGVVDRRLDTAMLTSLSQQMSHGNIMLIGPQQDPDEAILRLPNVHALGPRKFGDLPQLAGFADVLIMPYADLPVTRAMQPLKMKEYMATGRPVVVSALPAVLEWDDCLDVTTSPAEFAATVLRRVATGIDQRQQQARRRLNQQSWSTRARQLATYLRLSEKTEHVATDLPVLHRR
ncbi:MAG: glycosyltransferase [Fuerstiella sp.]